MAVKHRHGGAAEALLAWFRVASRDLPWRTPWPRDPYLVLVSEVMLQQTQVDRVAPVYRRFVARFPDVRSLAAAREDEVLAAFSGLGYYRRAARLHRAAQAVAAEGAWPRDAAGLGRLPGLGAYASAAVAAFAFGASDPPVDGNVMRVAARLGALALTPGPQLRAAAAARARALHAEAGTAAVFESLMELGATVCTPRPRCDACPLAPRCAGRRSDPTRFPRPRARRAPEAHRWVALWLETADGRVLLRQQRGPLLDGIWLPPLTEIDAHEDPAAAAARLLRAAGGRRPAVARAPVRHAITHRRITVLPFAGRAPARRALADGWRLAHPEDPRVATSSLLAKLSARCRGAAAVGPGRTPRSRRAPS